MLTDEQIDAALDSLNPGYWDVPYGSTEKFARLIEATVLAEREAQDAYESGKKGASDNAEYLISLRETV